MVQSLTERQKRYLRKVNLTCNRFALDKPKPAIKKTRDFLTIKRADYIPRRPRGVSRVQWQITLSRIAARATARDKFFAEL